MSDPEDEARYRRLRDTIGEAIEATLGELGEFTTKWLVVIETVEAADGGTRGVWMATNEGATAWDNKGLLMEALDRERAATLWDVRPDG